MTKKEVQLLIDAIYFISEASMAMEDDSDIPGKIICELQSMIEKQNERTERALLKKIEKLKKAITKA